MDNASLFIGIDFGTSKCAMSWYNPKTQQAEILRNHEGREETPSIVYLGQRKSDLRVGGPALDRLENESASSERFSASVKRDLRADWRKILDDGTVYEPTDIAAAIFRKLKQDAEELHFHGKTITRAVITYPASFDVLQQDRIRAAAIKSGFNDIILLHEPEAAALAYSRTALNAGKCLLIYDFGAGTFDVAVVSSNSLEEFSLLLRPEGLKNCGGDDLDRELYSYCDEIAQEDLGRSISLNEDLDLNFLRKCRQRKENLSREEEQVFSTYLPVEDGAIPIRFSHKVTRAAFEERSKTYIERTVTLTQKMLRDVEQKGSSVDTVVLIGGSSRIPLVRSLLSSTLPVQPREWQQRDFAVALGAAYHGHTVWGISQVQPSASKKSTSAHSPTPPDARPKNTHDTVPTPQKPEAKRPSTQSEKGELIPSSKTRPTPLQPARPIQSNTSTPKAPSPAAHPVTRSNTQPRSPQAPSQSPAEQLPIGRSSDQLQPAWSGLDTPSQSGPNSPPEYSYIPPRRSRSTLETIFSTLFLLLFGSLAFMEFFKGMHVSIVPLPLIGPDVGWPVMTLLTVLSLWLFGRSIFSKCLVFFFLLLFGIATFLLIRGSMHITVTSLWTGPNIGWPVMAVLTALALWLLILKLMDKRHYL